MNHYISNEPSRLHWATKYSPMSHHISNMSNHFSMEKWYLWATTPSMRHHIYILGHQVSNRRDIASPMWATASPMSHHIIIFNFQREKKFYPSIKFSSWNFKMIIQYTVPVKEYGNWSSWYLSFYSVWTMPNLSSRVIKRLGLTFQNCNTSNMYRQEHTLGHPRYAWFGRKNWNYEEKGKYVNDWVLIF